MKDVRSYNNTEVFFSLLRAGLWEGINENENHFEGLDWGEAQKLAEEHSVVGLVAAGLEKLPAGILPLTEKLKFLGKCQLIEQQNVAMNRFVADLVKKMQDAGIKVVLVKGQGVAQCYERPLWRSSGDVDFLFDDENYAKAKALLLPMANKVDPERGKHYGMAIGPWTVELHGYLLCGLSRRMNKVIEDVQHAVFRGGKKRTWKDGDVSVDLPAADEDVIFVFTHFLKHFYRDGFGIKQVCDWCRLLWIYRDTLDVQLLEQRLRTMRLMTEWKAFAAFAVDWLGMPIEAMSLYDGSNRWKRKAKRIEDFVIKSGEFGQERAIKYTERSYISQKMHSMLLRIRDSFHHVSIFPLDTMRFMPNIILNGLRSAARGE